MKRKRLDVIQSVRFSAEDIDRIRSAADANGLNVSEYIRRIVVRLTPGRNVMPWPAPSPTTSSAASITWTNYDPPATLTA